MSSINDWAAKAADYIVDEQNSYRGRALSTRRERIAAIIATSVQPLLELLRASKREHHGRDDDDDPCDKTNYLDGEHPCTCGADLWNAKVDAVLAGEPIVDTSLDNFSRADNAKLGPDWTPTGHAEDGTYVSTVDTMKPIVTVEVTDVLGDSLSNSVTPCCGSDWYVDPKWPERLTCKACGSRGPRSMLQKEKP